MSNKSHIVMFLEWLKSTDTLGVILSEDKMYVIYEKYLNVDAGLQQDEKIQLFCFMYKTIGCVNLHWKENALAGARYSEIVTQSDKTMGFFVLKYYGSVPPDNGQPAAVRKQKLSGKLLKDAMIWFNKQSRTLAELKIQHLTRVQELDQELNAHIMNEVKMYLRGQSIISDTPSQTTLREKAQLNNLHDYTKLFGTPQAAL